MLDISQELLKFNEKLYSGYTFSACRISYRAVHVNIAAKQDDVVSL